MKSYSHTRKNKPTIHNKTQKKIYQPLIKYLHKGYLLYAAKSINGQEILDYQKNMYYKTKNKCLLENISWFGDLDVAKSYKTSTNNIYKWSIKVKTNLLMINKQNELFLEFIFKNNNKRLYPTIQLNNTKLNKINIKHPYLNMNNNERAFYEFKFVFGYLTLEEQYEFLNFIEFLIKNKIIEMKTRDNKSVLTKIKAKKLYYKINIFFERKQKYNRLSFYNLDKHAVMNLCIALPNKYNISGIYQENDDSFWFPDFIIYKMNIQEYILFYPPKNLHFIPGIIL
jgi:hypothetical protein